VVAVPSEDHEGKRALIRYHRQIMGDVADMSLEVKGCCALKASKSKAAGGEGTAG
jgi:hypothetical protein